MKKSWIFAVLISLTAFGAHAEDEHGHDHAPAVMEGMVVKEAEGGRIARHVSFPAEVVLNRDRVVTVSPPYPSIIREVFAEVGDEVQPGDRLAILENRETLARYTLSAPQEGIITARQASSGESVGDDTVLFEIADLSSVWVEIRVFPQYRHGLAKGQEVTLVAADGHRMESVVHYISPLMSKDSRTVHVRCALHNPEEDFMPGAFVQAILVVDQTDARVRVEKSAIQKVSGETVVFVEEEEGEYASREVTVGLSDSAHVEILAGLEPGESYVAEGAFELKANMVTSGMDPHAGHGH